MQCQSCSENISLKQKFCIDKNVCPYCGQNIMEEDLQICLSEFMGNFVTLKEKYPTYLSEVLSEFGFRTGHAPGVRNANVNKNTVQEDDALPVSEGIKTRMEKIQQQQARNKQIKESGRGMVQSRDYNESPVDVEALRNVMDEEFAPEYAAQAMAAPPRMSGDTDEATDLNHIIALNKSISPQQQTGPTDQQKIDKEAAIRRLKNKNAPSVRRIK